MLTLLREDPSRYDGWSLDLRDPEFIRAVMPFNELAYRYYFRVEARGFENTPESGPFLLIGNHNGGISTPDTGMTAHAWYSCKGADAPIYGLVHPQIFDIPYLNVYAMKIGGIRAHPRAAMAALERGAPLLIYPGGGDDVYRTYDRRHEIVLSGRTAFVKLALRYGLPIVPIVTLGGHDSLIVLDDGKDLARALGLDRYGVERLPIALTLPWGLTVGVVPYWPLPIRIEIEVGTAISWQGLGPESARDREVVRACYLEVERAMQGMLDRMVAARAGRQAAETARAGS
ncbi:MAG: lysophospholipid acyltransferase family protein [Thermoanaerobaculia bacterium]